MPFKTNVLARYTCVLLSLLLSSSIFAQKAVTGRVTSNADKQPIAGATIQVKGTKVATQTSLDGTFSIQAPKDNSVLVITVVGFEPQTIALGGRLSLGDIPLVVSTTSLNDVVVTGYTSQRKKDITGAVAVVSVANMKSVPGGNTAALLQGQASGVTVFNSGVPGAATKVQIRGITSVGSTDPLIIVDGTPGGLQDLNVNDIESIQVLKDAGAAAIYGVRGSNGVIIVTTKRGRQGKARLVYDGYYGTQQPLSKGYQIATPQETADAIWAQYKNDGLAPTHKQFGSGPTPIIPDYITPTATMNGGPNTADSTYALYTNQITKTNKTGTDWFHEIFKPAPIQSHTISASGGSDKSAYYFSLGYFDQQGTLIETYLKRYSARINTVFNIADHVRIGENAYIFYKQSPGFTNQNEGNALSMSYRESPLIPVYDTRGNFAGSNSKGFGNPQNPVANQVRTHDNKGNDWQINGNVFAEVDFLKHFTIRSSFGGNVDNYYYNSFSYTAYENAENNTNPNQFQENFGYNSSWTWTNTLKYTNVFAEKHSLTALIGTEAIQNYQRAIQGTRGPYYITNPGSLLVDPNLWTLSFGPPAGQTTQNINSTPFQSSLYSLFGRVDYAFADKYLLSATVRRDGSSIFGSDVRYGVFPSVTAGWRISKEDFMQNIAWLNDLKIRGGWGKLGSISNTIATNQYYLYSTTAANAAYDINGTSNSSALGIYESQFGNPVGTWEKDVISNIGFDATILKNKLDVSIDWYTKSINDLLFQAALPSTAGGAAAPYVNAGDIKNTGIDAAITYHGTINKDFKFDITGTITSYDNKVVSLPAGIQYYDINSSGSTRIGAFSRLAPGHAVGAFFGYEETGLWQSQAEIDAANQKAQQATGNPNAVYQDAAAPGRMKFADVNGDGHITADDRTFFGNPNPKFTYGINIGASYKGFDFSMFFYGSEGNDVINYVRYWIDFPQVFDAAIGKEAATNSWTPTNTGAKVPILERAANFSNTTTFNSYYKESGSFLKCKSLIIGYTIPSASLRKIGIERLRVYVQGANLFMVTKYTGLDPELQGSTLNTSGSFGIDQGNYPSNQKNYNIGLSLSF